MFGVGATLFLKPDKFPIIAELNPVKKQTKPRYMERIDKPIVLLTDRCRWVKPNE